MILYHQLHVVPVRAADAVPMQQRLVEEHRARLDRIRRAATQSRPEPAFTVRPFRTVPQPPPAPITWPEYAEPVPYETMDFGPRRPPPLTAREIIDQVAIKHGVSRDDIASRSRRAGVVNARSEACWRIRNEVPVNGRQISLPEIARFRGGRDHTTILHNIRKFEAELAAGKVTA